MAVSSCGRIIFRHQITKQHVFMPSRASNTLPRALMESHRKSKLSHNRHEKEPEYLEAPRDFKYIYPEFLPTTNIIQRDKLREKLERMDMIRRRANIDIPEFYVGSVMAVTASDPYSPGKKNRFVGICISRDLQGLRANFILRNVIDSQGVEVMYEMYSPLLLKIEVLKLEKRLDNKLFYLRDAPPEYSTIPFDMETTPHPPGAPVPVNQIKVKLGPRPWHERWERQDLQGVQDLDLPQRFYDKAKAVAKPWEKKDLMKQYRESINDVETEEVMSEVAHELNKVEKMKKGKRRE